LSELETQSTAGAVGLPMVKLVVGYDAGSRRVMKRVYANLGGTTTAPNWVLQNDVRFVYVGWHMIAEPRRGTEARLPDGRVGCPAGVRIRAEHPKQHELKGNATDAPAGGGVNPPPFLRRSWLWGKTSPAPPQPPWETSANSEPEAADCEPQYDRPASHQRHEVRCR